MMLGLGQSLVNQSVAATGSAPPVFDGVLDDYTSNMAGAWSVGRRLLGSYTGSLIRVRESAGNTEADIGYDEDGNLDEVALLAHCGANSGYVRTIYDQSGGTNHLEQSTTSKQPAVVLSGVVQKINDAPMCTRNASFFNATDSITGSFTAYVTGRNGLASPINNFSSIMTIGGNESSPFLSICDIGSLGMDWEVFDKDTATYSLGLDQRTWGALVIANTGVDAADNTVRRANANQVLTHNLPATTKLFRLGQTSDLHMECAEAVLYSSSHLSGTITAIQAILNGWIAPALAALMVLSVDSAIAGQNPATASTVYSVTDHGAETYVRNSGCWGSGFVEALTAISPYNTDGGIHKAGVLISPRHVLFATHYTPATSSVMHFVKSDGTCVTRTLSSVSSVTDTATNYPDFTVGLLDSDVPAGIEFARVLPTNFLYSIVVSAFDHIPAMCVNLDEDLLVMDLSTLPAAKSPLQRIAFGAPTDSQRLAFHDDLVSGDSGSPLFWIVDGKMVILTVALTTISGAHVAPWHTEINTAMTTLGGGYTLTDIDLSSYGTF